MVYRSIVVLLIIVRISRASVTFNNVSVPIAELPYPDEIPQQQWLSRLFDHHAWNNENVSNVSHLCKKQIDLYLKELKLDRFWAIKMNDASGRYNGQFFFGNDFWLGSSTLCWELGNPETNSEVPPFPVRFTMAKVHIALHRIHEMPARQLRIGFCLPTSCSPLDLKTLLASDAEKAVEKLRNTTLDIMDVKLIPGDYDILKDIKFYIVGGVTVVVAILVAVATIAELWLGSYGQSDTNDEIHTTNNNVFKNVQISPEGTDKRENKELAWRLLLSFSALANGKKILQVDKLPDDSIKCLHGLRFLSVSWVIIGHTYFQVFIIADNKGFRTITERVFFFQIISNATFSVDSFFFISGLLVTILYFRISKKPTAPVEPLHTTTIFLDSTKQFFLLILRRLIRLTPAYLLVLGMHEVSRKYFLNKTFFEPISVDHVNCDHYWWRNMLYINNWYPQKEMCMVWSWYISNDMQLYVLAVMLLLIAVRSDAHLKLAGLLLFGFLFSSWVTSFTIAWQNHYHVKREQPVGLFDQLYDKPWTRIGPYLVGMITGWVLYKVQGKYRMHWGIVLVGWATAMATLLSLVYGVGKDGIVLPLSAVYAALSHSAWGLALAWIVFACSTGYGGPVNSILSFRGFLPFSRLTYCAYLVHPMLMSMFSLSLDGPLHLHNNTVLIIYFGIMVVAFLFSFMVSLGFEAPIQQLLKIITGGRS